MAFALGPLRRPHAPDQDVVRLLRRDIESTERSSAVGDPGETSVDWLADRDSAVLRLDRFVTEQRCRHPRVASWFAPLLTLLNRATWDRLARERVDRGCSMLSRGRVVVTDRLHGHILSLLLGIPHVVLDNSYGKLRSFCETWTKSSDLAHWAETPAEANALATRLVPSRPDAQVRFRPSIPR
jgi:pyruvyl transferase EpsO